MNTHPYDAMVIGSGGGLKFAMAAAQRGFNVALIEQDACGGTCLNRGCIPSKMLIYPTDMADRIRDAAKINLDVRHPPRVDFAGLITRIGTTVDAMSESLRDRCRAIPNLDYHTGHARFTGTHTLRVNDRTLRGKRIVIATGSRPALPDIPGLTDTPFMTSAQALRSTTLPRHLLVLGGGYIGVEIGNAYRAAGCQVTFLVRSRLLRQEDREISDTFAALFRRHNTVIDGFAIDLISRASDALQVEGRTADGQSHSVHGDSLLVATGVVPNTDDMGLPHAGVECGADGFIHVDRCLRTTAQGVYAIGDAVGRYLFRHTVNREVDYLLDTVFSNATPTPFDYGPVPHAVFTDPEVAGVGLTEDAAAAQELDYVIGRSQFAESNQGLARQLTGGLCKLIVDRASRHLLGAHIVGEEASTLIHIPILLMKTGGTLDDLLEMIFIHPAMPEIVRDAARDAAAGFAENGSQPTST